jgi:hypothetical protein
MLRVLGEVWYGTLLLSNKVGECGSGSIEFKSKSSIRIRYDTRIRIHALSYLRKEKQYLIVFPTSYLSVPVPVLFRADFDILSSILFSWIRILNTDPDPQIFLNPYEMRIGINHPFYSETGSLVLRRHGVYNPRSMNFIIVF